jgi:hypothetical protein
LALCECKRLKKNKPIACKASFCTCHKKFEKRKKPQKIVAVKRITTKQVTITWKNKEENNPSKKCNKKI